MFDLSVDLFPPYFYFNLLEGWGGMRGNRNCTNQIISNEEVSLIFTGKKSYHYFPQFLIL